MRIQAEGVWRSWEKRHRNVRQAFIIIIMTNIIINILLIFPSHHHSSLVRISLKQGEKMGSALNNKVLLINLIHFCCITCYFTKNKTFYSYRVIFVLRHSCNFLLDLRYYVQALFCLITINFKNYDNLIVLCDIYKTN